MLWLLLSLIVFFAIVVIAFTFPSVQTRAAKWLTDDLNEKYGVNIAMESIAIKYDGDVVIGKTLVLDHKNDTLIAFKKLESFVLDYNALINGNIRLGNTGIENLHFNMMRYKGESSDNLSQFIKKFNTKKSTEPVKPFVLTTGELVLQRAYINIADENSETNPIVFNAKSLNGNIDSFSVEGSNIQAKISHADFVMYTSSMRYQNVSEGMVIRDLKADLSYTNHYLQTENLELVTAGSKLIGNLKLSYKIEDFKDFNNKVFWDLQIDEANLATNELRYFSQDLAQNQAVEIKGHLTGTLNDMRLEDVYATNGTSIVVDASVLKLKNALDLTQGIVVEGQFNRLQTNKEDLENFLPVIFKNLLPTQISQLGTITYNGYLKATNDAVKLDGKGETRKSKFETDLALNNMKSGRPTYKGRVMLANLDVGSLSGITSLGNTSLDVYVDGRGFTLEELNTSVKGKVNSFYYNGYTYKNINVDGNFANPLFNGHIDISDPNLDAVFDGLVDLSKANSSYVFNANIGYANLKALNLFTRDDKSILKAVVAINMQGSTLDDVVGTINFKDASYRNEKQDYFFEDFNITSRFEEEIRFISINSTDIVEGEISGLFKLAEIPELFKNSIGNLYTNYRSKTITEDQNLKYEFQIYDKIVDLFFPQIQLGENTILKGEVASNNGVFKMTFRTPFIDAYDMFLDNVNVQVDNQNPLFNTFIKVDNFKNGVYDLNDFKLINVTRQDTLLFRTEFVSNDRPDDKFNLSFYHTVESDNNSVIGIRTSDITFQGNKWFLNQANKKVKLRFDHDFKKFSLDTLLINHNQEKIFLAGDISGLEDKDVGVTFENVRVASLLKPMDSLAIGGRINGNLDVKQLNGKYKPTSDISIAKLAVNETSLGDFNLNIIGNEDLTRYNVNAQLANANANTFTANGYIDTSGSESTLDLNVAFNDFNLVAINPFGGEVLDNIRGLANGRGRIDGPLKKPRVDASIRLLNAGLRVPYLNIDYDIDRNTIIDITSTSVDFNTINLTDTKYGTKGTLSGKIKHQNFGFWNMDLSINSNRLVVLDTELTPESLYYGTAFIDGQATIKGPTQNLVIAVTATSKEGTVFKVPIKDGESLGDTSAIYFLSPDEKAARISGKVIEARSINGLELLFDLKITPDALVEITVDPANQSAIAGRGYGNLQLEINTNGKFIMNGDFIVTEGVYNFRYYGGLVNKDFIIEPGGTMIWTGDPTKANIDVSAVYKTRANPSVLLDNPNINAQIAVEVVTTLDGDLTYFDPEFAIRFPDVQTVTASELQYRLEDKSQRQYQALSLVTTGSFYNPSSIGQNAISGNVAESLTGIVNSIVATDDSRIDFDITYEASERNPNSDIQRSDRFGINLSTQISDRIFINGRLGVPVGTTSTTERAVVGNVEIEFLLNKDGTLRLRLFNRENTIQQIGQQENYTQGLGLQYSVNFDTMKELYEKLFKKKLTVDRSFRISDNDVGPVQFYP